MNFRYARQFIAAGKRRPVATIASSEDGCFIGVSVCSKKDVFDKRVGRALAVDRIVCGDSLENVINITIPVVKYYSPALFLALERAVAECAEKRLEELHCED